MFWRKNNEAAPPPDYSEAAPLPELSDALMNQRYPAYLQLVQAQVFFRHGERTPMKARLTKDEKWLHCERANYLHSEFMKAIGRFVPLSEEMPVPHPERIGSDSQKYTRKTATLKSGIEYEPAKWILRLGSKSAAAVAANWTPASCGMGQLTDVGLDTLHRAGTHLRSLYADRLKLVPREPGDSARDWLYVRSTDYSRVLQSTHALLAGMFPSRNGSWPAFNKDFLRKFPIHTRLHHLETMHGNFGCFEFIKHFMDISCKDARQLKWIDDVYKQTVQLASIGDSARRMMDEPNFGSNFHIVYDELISLAAHGRPLPTDVEHDHVVNLGRVGHHQWMHPVHSVTGQRLGFGRLLNDIMQTMVQATTPASKTRIGAQHEGDLLLVPGGVRAPTAAETPGVPRLALYGCHDVTIAPLAIMMGSVDPNWLPFASMLTFELFKDDATPAPQPAQCDALPKPSTLTQPVGKDHYVRVLLNDQVLTLPTCQAHGKHHSRMGSSLCTLDAFLEHVAPIIATEEDYAKDCGTMPAAFDYDE
ncbi:hypothetical protein GGH12_005266 [Coemansia sp. RSA 1822]|nr:hypothetical protein LPJ76_002347 [Coemansia sp. RSA 638]KAJ2538476.1 hypothetical protein GGF49_005886 [Coemansia sp. RSA 1853]KAJ2559742.1 hypothetical protein GGH12_005266 [Coemansia sp. RSA 1822]